MGRRTCRTAAVIAALSLAGGMTACGDDEEDAPVGAAGSTSTAAEPAAFAYGVSGTERAPVFTAPRTATAGANTITFTNDAKAGIDGQLIRVEGDRPYEEVVAAFEKATSGKALPDWFRAAGGVGSVEPGESVTVTQELQPGTHYVMGGEKAPAKAVSFTVEEGEGAPLPETEGAVVATEYAFEGRGLKPGRNTVTFRNDGKEIHHFLSAELQPGKTAADAVEFFKTEKGPPPFAGEEGSGIETAVLEGGESQTQEVDLKAGKYAFFCFVADRAGGPPHVMKGMVSEVEVAG